MSRDDVRVQGHYWGPSLAAICDQDMAADQTPGLSHLPENIISPWLSSLIEVMSWVQTKALASSPLEVPNPPNFAGVSKANISLFFDCPLQSLSTQRVCAKLVYMQRVSGRADGAAPFLVTLVKTDKEPLQKPL